MSSNFSELAEAKLREAVRLRIDIQKQMSSHCILQNCLNCEYWSQNGSYQGRDNEPLCRYYGQLPPPNIIVHGCESHVFDIPF